MQIGGGVERYKLVIIFAESANLQYELPRKIIHNNKNKHKLTRNLHQRFVA